MKKAASYIFNAFLSFSCLVFVSEGNAEGTGISAMEWFDSGYQALLEKGEKGLRIPIVGLHVYLKEGLHLDSRRKHLRIKIGGRMHVDGGSIRADEALDSAFPNLERRVFDFRRLFLDVSGTLFDFIEFRTQIDFSDVGSIKDNWIGLRNIPLIGHVKAGHMKEPFSLEEMMSSNHYTFMEEGLPTGAIAPGRNVGILCHNAILNGRMTWAAGGFWDVGSLSRAGDETERIETSAGVNVTGRVTGLPWYGDKGRRLVHLGLSYSHQFRDEERIESLKILNPRPESALTVARLVNTGLFSASGLDLINPELAVVYGPFSLQAEYFHVLANGPEDLNFWGFYLYGSYILTGENRIYNKSKGVFSGIRPRHNFHPFKGGWGAWELAFRCSYLDLNDKGIGGGKEGNFTAGLNWYLSPNLRVMFNYVRANVEERNVPSIDNESADIFQTRLQLNF